MEPEAFSSCDSARLGIAVFIRRNSASASSCPSKGGSFSFCTAAQKLQLSSSENPASKPDYGGKLDVPCVFICSWGLGVCCRMGRVPQSTDEKADPSAEGRSHAAGSVGRPPHTRLTAAQTNNLLRYNAFADSLCRSSSRGHVSILRADRPALPRAAAAGDTTDLPIFGNAHRRTGSRTPAFPCSAGHPGICSPARKIQTPQFR